MESPAENDLKQLRRVYDLFNDVKAVEFETDEAKELKQGLNEAIDEIIKPHLVKVGKYLEFLKE